MLLHPRHIILILSQPVFALTLRGEAANTNIIVFGSTGPVVKLRSYHIYTPAITPPMWLTGPVVKLRSYHIYTPAITPPMWLALSDAVVISFLKVKKEICFIYNEIL